MHESFLRQNQTDTTSYGYNQVRKILSASEPANKGGPPPPNNSSTTTHSANGSICTPTSCALGSVRALVAVAAGGAGRRALLVRGRFLSLSKLSWCCRRARSTALAAFASALRRLSSSRKGGRPRLFPS